MTARILTTDADATELLMLPCPCCKGRRTETFSTGGRMSDWIAIPCPTCAGRGVTPATDEERALLDQITADIDAAIREDEVRQGAEVAETIEELAAWMGVNVSTPVTVEERIEMINDCPKCKQYSFAEASTTLDLIVMDARWKCEFCGYEEWYYPSPRYPDPKECEVCQGTWWLKNDGQKEKCQCRVASAQQMLLPMPQGKKSRQRKVA